MKFSKALGFLAAATLLTIGCKSGDSTDTPADNATKSAPMAKKGDGDVAGTPAATPTGSPEYVAAQEVFNKSCIGCHGAGKAKGGIHLTDQAAILKGGKEGPVVVAGDPAGSLLMKAMKSEPGAKPMPPSGKLADDEVKKVEDWIKGGAKA